MSSTAEQCAQPETPHLVLVTGAGRSGTSTIAGVLSRLGFRVPQPVLKENESNPRGFYESWWPVRFHNRLMKRADITPTDGRPSAAALMTGALDDKAGTELRAWLREQFDGSSMVVVKDPRAAWAPMLWSDAAASIGADIGFVTMLRHPTEVIGSRKTYYAANQAPEAMRTFAIRHLCGWVNQNLTLERLNRGQRRSFVHYVDLVSDWRPEVARMLDELDLTEYVTTSSREHEIDDFIEPSLRRHDTSWERFELPPNLIDIAERTWLALSALTKQPDRHADVEPVLDEIGEQYAQVYADASAISLDVAESMARGALKRGRRQGRDEAVKKQAEAARTNRLIARASRSARSAFRHVSHAVRGPGRE